jgi:hypothetical protein
MTRLGAGAGTMRAPDKHAGSYSFAPDKQTPSAKTQLQAVQAIQSQPLPGNLLLLSRLCHMRRLELRLVSHVMSMAMLCVWMTYISVYATEDVHIRKLWRKARPA